MWESSLELSELEKESEPTTEKRQKTQAGEDEEEEDVDLSRGEERPAALELEQAGTRSRVPA